MAVLASLADVKAHLNMTSSAHDVELQRIIDAASERVTALVGSFDSGASTERVVVGSGGVIVLSRRPVVGAVTIDGAAVAEDSIDRAAGVVFDAYRWGTGRALSVSYASGTGAVPTSVSLATQIVAAHLWETQRGQAPSPLSVQDEDLDRLAGRGYALPNRARELLEPYIRTAQVL